MNEGFVELLIILLVLCTAGIIVSVLGLLLTFFIETGDKFALIGFVVTIAAVLSGAVVTIKEMRK